MLQLFVESDARALKFRVAAAAAGVSLSVTVVPIAAASAHAVVSTSPFRTLPVLSTSDGPVSRSAPILRYIASLACDSGLMGRGYDALYSEASVDSWLEFSQLTLEPLAAALSPAASQLLDAASLAAARAMAVARFPPTLAALDAALQSRTFLAGERLTIADVTIACTLAGVWETEGIDTAAWSHLTRWYFTCRHTPAFLSVLGVPDVAVGSAAASAPRGFSAIDALDAVGRSALVPMASSSAFSGRFVRQRARIADLLASGEAAIGRTIVVCGWLKNSREGAAGSLLFAAINDGSCFDNVQVVSERGKTEGFEALGKCGGTGSSIRVEGTVVKSQGKGQIIEVFASAVKVLGTVTEPERYPLPTKKHTMEYLREIQHLRPRSNTIGAVARVRNACAFATHKFFQERGFLYVHTPIITAADCEGAGEMFAVTTLLPASGRGDLPRTKEGNIDFSKDFFKRPTMLTVSGQLQVEAFSCSMSDVYTFGPTFRAENSHTSRHLAEFWMIEPEIAFATLAEDMALAEDYLKFATQWVLDNCAEDLKFFEETFEKGLRERLRNVVAEPFKVLTYTEAIEMLSKPEHQAAGKFAEKIYWGCDLASEHERYITEKVFKKPVILINYPKEIKSFYMKLNPDAKTVAAMDVLVPKIGEIIGGSQREDNFDLLTARMAELKIVREPLEWYLDLRKYGSVPHAGFGLGFERLIMYVTGIENIRDVIPFPRYPGNADM